jgi:hypothetical protein
LKNFSVTFEFTESWWAFTQSDFEILAR